MEDHNVLIEFVNVILLSEERSINELKSLSSGVDFFYILNQLHKSQKKEFTEFGKLEEKRASLSIVKKANLNTIVKYLQQEDVPVIVSVSDIVRRKEDEICRLLWKILLKYHVNCSDVSVEFGQYDSAVSEICTYLNKVLEKSSVHSPEKEISNFSEFGEKGGFLFHVLVKSLFEEQFSEEFPVVWGKGTINKVVSKCMDVADEKLGIPKYLDSKALLRTKNPLQKILYLSFFRNYGAAHQSESKAEEKTGETVEGKESVEKILVSKIKALEEKLEKSQNENAEMKEKMERMEKGHGEVVERMEKARVEKVESLQTEFVLEKQQLEESYKSEVGIRENLVKSLRMELAKEKQEKVDKVIEYISQLENQTEELEKLEERLEDRTLEVQQMGTEVARLEQEKAQLVEQSEYNSKIITNLKFYIASTKLTGEGWLLKESFKGRMGKNWKYRYFKCALINGTFKYFKKGDDVKPIKTIQIPPGYKCERFEGKKKFAFRIMSKTEDGKPWVFNFAASNEMERNRWINYWNKQDPLKLAQEIDKEYDKIKKKKEAEREKMLEIKRTTTEMARKKVERKTQLLKEVHEGEKQQRIKDVKHLISQLMEADPDPNASPLSSEEANPQPRNGNDIEDVRKEIEEVERKIRERKEMLRKKKLLQQRQRMTMDPVSGFGNKPDQKEERRRTIEMDGNSNYSLLEEGFFDAN